MLRNLNRMLGLGSCLLVLAAMGGCSSKAADWTFTDAQGSVKNLSDYEGRVVVLGFTNTWCDPCQEAGLQLQAMHEKFGPAGVKVMSVSAWERGHPEDWMEENGYSYAVMLNGTEIAREYDVNRLPTYFVLGMDGKVLYRHDGFDENIPDKIAKTVNKHLRRHGHTGLAQGG